MALEFAKQFYQSHNLIPFYKKYLCRIPITKLGTSQSHPGQEQDLDRGYFCTAKIVATFGRRASQKTEHSSESPNALLKVTGHNGLPLIMKYIIFTTFNCM